MNMKTGENYLYIKKEISLDPRIPAQEIIKKVGIMENSTNSAGEFGYGRDRALRQGNVRSYEDERLYKFDDYQDAKIVESIIHSYLDKQPNSSLHAKTGLTGHGEWYEFDTSELDVIINLVISLLPKIKNIVNYEYVEFADGKDDYRIYRKPRAKKYKCIAARNWATA